MLSKITKLGLALLLSISSLSLFNNDAQAAETLTTEQELELAKLFQEHLYGDENYELHINESEILETKLNEKNIPLTIKDIENYVTDYNSKITGEQGTEIQNTMLNDLENFQEEVDAYLNGSNQSNNGISTFSAANTVCSAAMTGVGISNSAFIGFGAVALGVSGPAGWAAAAAAVSTSALWGAGGVIAC